MITQPLVQKIVNAGRVGGTVKGKVGRERIKDGRRRERGEKGERNRYKGWGKEEERRMKG